MKKVLLFVFMMAGTLATHADDYPYLTFELTDGSKTSVAVTSLSLSISGSTLTAGDQSFTLSNLSKMYFSADDQTTDIQHITITNWDEVSEIYDLNGRKVTKDQMQRGVYIVKSKNKTCKVVVK
jgi:hypothetical protein